MNVLVIGATGMLGGELVRELEGRGHSVQAPGRNEIDLTDPESVAKVAQMKGIDWCVNCAAYTAVDKAESEEQAAAELNALGPGYLARACAMAGIKLIHISTDFVYDGVYPNWYTEEQAANPLGVYGRTKLAGEDAVLAGLPTAIIFRTAWLYGPTGKNFPKTMINAWKAEKELKVVVDQTGCPTYAPDLARTIVDAIEKDIFPGIYHAVGPNGMTWYELASRAIKAYKNHHGIDLEVRIAALRSQDWPTPARRPKNSILATTKLQAAGIAPMRPIAEALEDFAQKVEL